MGAAPATAPEEGVGGRKNRPSYVPLHTTNRSGAGEEGRDPGGWAPAAPSARTEPRSQPSCQHPLPGRPEGSEAPTALRKGRVIIPGIIALLHFPIKSSPG